MTELSFYHDDESRDALRDACREHGLSTRGSKAQLLERVNNWVRIQIQDRERKRHLP